MIEPEPDSKPLQPNTSELNSQALLVLSTLTGLSRLCSVRMCFSWSGTWGVQSLIARIVGENEGSIRLHEKCGFTLVGTEIEVGRKHGIWLDVVEYQYVVAVKRP